MQSPLLPSIPDSLELEPLPQKQVQPATFTVRSLYADRKQFIILSDFQRQEVWPVWYKHALIDTMLRGNPIPPILAQQSFDANGKRIYNIVDGHQRLSTIWKYLAGVFSTWSVAQKNRSEPNSGLPCQPGCTFDKLSLHAHNYLLDYTILFQFLPEGMSPRDLANHYVRVQNQMSLTPAEKLNAYYSAAKIYAMGLREHALWKEFYGGADNRLQTLQSSLHLMLLELRAAEVYVDVQSPTLVNALAAGLWDKDLKSSILDNLERRLDIVINVFDGSYFTARGSAIVMYQAVVLLEQAGHCFTKADKGALTKWMKTIQLASQNPAGISEYNRSLARMTHKNSQRNFWEAQKRHVYATFGRVS